MGTASMVFEGDGLMTFEVKNSLKITVGDLGDIISSCEEGEPPIDSYLRFFYIESDEETGETTISRDYTKAGHELRNQVNREFERVTVEKMTRFAIPTTCFGVHDKSSQRIKGNKKRFKSFDDEVYQSFKFFDPK